MADPGVASSNVVNGHTPGSTKIVLAIKSGRPVARSTLRKALHAVRQATGVMFDIDDYIVDQRTL